MKIHPGTDIDCYNTPVWVCERIIMLVDKFFETMQESEMP